MGKSIQVVAESYIRCRGVELGDGRDAVFCLDLAILGELLWRWCIFPTLSGSYEGIRIAAAHHANFDRVKVNRTSCSLAIAQVKRQAITHPLLRRPSHTCEAGLHQTQRVMACASAPSLRHPHT